MPPRGNVIDDLGMATVTRDPRTSIPPQEDGQIATSVSKYALGVIDTLRAPSPLPQYLALVYGGEIENRTVSAPSDTAAERVDEFAAAYPEWEPDALYAALV